MLKLKIIINAVDLTEESLLAHMSGNECSCDNECNCNDHEPSTNCGCDYNDKGNYR